MATPTLSIQIAGQIAREAALARTRSEAAKKAWRTRRRRAKVSPAMRKVLAFLASDPRARIALHYHGMSLYCVSCCCINAEGTSGYLGNAPRRVTRTTFRALEKRGWVEYVRRRESGGTMGVLPSGKRGIVEASFTLDYRISDKGCRALETAATM